MRMFPASGSSTSTRYGPCWRRASWDGLQTRSQLKMRPRGSIAVHSRSNEWQWWQSHSGPNCHVLQCVQRCTRRRFCRNPAQYGADNPSGSGTGIGNPVGKIGRRRCVVHSVAPEPRRRLLAGVTIGPPITIATSFRLTWLADWPRIWRTASITNSKPCM